MTEDRYPFDRRFGPPPTREARVEDFIALMDRYGVGRAALVQAGYHGFDGSMIADLVARHPQRFAGFGMVDPAQPDVADRLSYWVEERGLAGMRVFGRFLEDPYFEAYWRRSAELGATLEVSPGHIDLGPLARFLDRLPPAPVVMDHLAHRRVNDRADCQQLLDLARFPHVYVKWSGFYYNSKEPYPHRDTEWLLRATLEAFGAQRIMIAGDFPYFNAPDEYDQRLGQFCQWYPFITEEDRAWILGKTAASLWRSGWIDRSPLRERG
jgi:predicted TIM-barrel fold metal-dependent hydrolase